MRDMVSGVVYFYMGICVALMLFNIFYIFRSKFVERGTSARLRRWQKQLHQLLARQDKQDDAIFAQLRSINELMAFHSVLRTIRENNPEEVAALFRANQTAVRDLAMYYRGREPMERAFLAFVIADLHEPAVDGPLTEILLSYMENSTVFCRENVLTALYALGNIPPIEHAFEQMNQKGWYHQPKLLSDGMIRFTGDRDALVRRMWQHRLEWADNLSIAALQLAAQLGPQFAEELLESLEDSRLGLEVRFAVIRYFGRWHFEPAKATLLHLLSSPEGEKAGLSIAVASALGRYPGEDTKDALKQAMHSRNWYVRRNAATSLAALGITPEDEAEVYGSGDRYSAEMLDYVTGKTGVQGKEAADQ